VTRELKLLEDLSESDGEGLHKETTTSQDRQVKARRKKEDVQTGRR